MRPARHTRLGIGLIGAGAIAQARHIPGLRAISGVELVTVANRTSASSRAAAARFGFARAARSWRDVVQAPDVDALVVATRPHLHAAATIAALEAGKHVLCQARMARTRAEAQAMVEAADARPELVTMLVPAAFSFWVDRTMGRALSEELMGELRSIHVHWAEPELVDPAESWRHQRRWNGRNIPGVGYVYELLERWLGPARSIQATTRISEPRKPGPNGMIEADLPDHVSMIVEFDDPAGGSGQPVALVQIDSHSAAIGGRVLTAYGEKGALAVDFRRRRLEIVSAEGPAGRRLAIPRPDQARWAVEREFVAAIRGGPPVLRNDFRTGLRYTAFTEAVWRAARQGRRISRVEAGGGW